jgi:hypothetical protein
MILSRRSLITGLASFVCAPAIVRASSIMPVKAFKFSMADGRAMQFAYNDLQQMWTEIADLVVNPPFPTSLEIKLRREEMARALGDLMRTSDAALAT